MYYDIELNLTMFSDIEYIKIAIANTYGKDKLEWADRLLWVETKTREELWNLVEEADEPYQMRKALHALEDVEAGKPTGYTMGLDSTASGCQMFAALSGCKQTAKAVNLIGDGKRHDLYKEVGKLLEVDVPRDELKQAVMTYFYQSEAMPEQVFGENVDIFYETLAAALPGAQEVLELCRTAQAFITDHYTCKNPSGHDVLIRQKVVKEYKVEAKTGYEGLRNFTFKQQRKEFGLKVNSKGEPNDKSIGAKKLAQPTVM